jgi:hypothetical protein
MISTLTVHAVFTRRCVHSRQVLSQEAGTGEGRFVLAPPLVTVLWGSGTHASRSDRATGF